jgi:competence protein ComEC
MLLWVNARRWRESLHEGLNVVRDGSFALTGMPDRGKRCGGQTGASLGSGTPAEKHREEATRFVIAPLAPLVAAVAAGIVADRWFVPFETQMWASIALTFGAVAIGTIGHTAVYNLAVLAAFGAVGAGWHHVRWSDLAKSDLAWSITETPRPAWIRGMVSEARGLRHQHAGFGFGTSHEEKVTTRFVLDLTAISDGQSWHNAAGRAVVVVAGDRSTIRAGQAVEAAGQIARVAPPLNPGEFDYRAFLQAQGIRLRLAIDEPESLWPDLNSSNWAFTFWIDNHRHRLQTWLFEQLDPSTAPLAAALLLGWRDEIDPEVNDAFARTGTTHLLAVSGLQLQALAAALLLIFRVVGVPRRPAYLMVGCTMLAYAMLVGPAPSVVRSTVMTVTFCLAAIGQRLARPANTLSLAALGTLGVNPMNLFDVGCQLSFLAIGALIWLVSPACIVVRRAFQTIREQFFGPSSALDALERLFEPWWRTALRRVGGTLVDGVVASTVVWLAALPLVANRFHLVSPIGIILNIPLIPITSAALLLGGLSLVLSAAWGPLGSPLAWAAAVLLKLTRGIVLWGVAQPWGHRFVVGPAWEWVIVFYALLALAALTATTTARRSRPTKSGRVGRAGCWWLVAAWIIPGWMLSGIATRDATLQAEFLAVGHGLAVLLHTPDGQTLLYDCGRLGDPTVGRRIIAPALWARGASRIDTVFLSHADQDHYDGLPDLLDRFAIGEVRLPPNFAGADNPMAIELIEQLKARRVPMRPITAPDSWQEAGAQFTVWHPSAGWHPETSDNARSLVLDVAFHGRHLLLTGDLEQLGLDELIERAPPQPPPDVFLAPHHGGKAANPERLYRWAQPRLVVVSQRPLLGKSGDALALVERSGIPLLRTWRQGAIQFTWMDDGIVARSFLANTADVADSPLKQNPDTAISQSHTVAARARPTTVTRLIIGCMAFGLGALVCVVVAIIEFAAWVLIAPPRSIFSGDFLATYPENGRQERPGEPIEVRAPDGARLAGRWLPAPGPTGTGRTALLLHGFAEASSALEARRAATLNRHGWNVAVLDSRGYGQSGGHYPTFGGREAGDIRAWIQLLSERIARIDPTRPFHPVLWGRSMGAAIALRTAAAEPGLAALVLESPMVDLDVSMALVLRRRKIPFPKLMAGLVTRRAGKLAGMPIHWPRPIDSARMVACPTLILHGTNDTIVAIDEARSLAAAMPAPAHWIEVPDARHTDVVDKGGEELLDRIAAFLDEAVSSDKVVQAEIQ